MLPQTGPGPLSILLRVMPFSRGSPCSQSFQPQKLVLTPEALWELGVCMCVSCGVSACACVWVCVRSGFPQSHVWGMCCLCRAGGGGGARRQQSTKERLRQAGRQAGRRQAACQGASALTPGLLKVGEVFRPGLLHAAMLPSCSSLCSPIQASRKSGLLSNPNCYYSPLPVYSEALPMWFSLKSNLHPSSAASIYKTSSRSGKRLPTLPCLLPSLPQSDHQTQKEHAFWGTD